MGETQGFCGFQSKENIGFARGNQGTEAASEPRMIDNAASPLGHTMCLCPAHRLFGQYSGPADYIRDQNDTLAAHTYYHNITF
jgi:hypothetical protein